MKTMEERMGQAAGKAAGSSPVYGATIFPLPVVDATDMPKSI